MCITFSALLILLCDSVPFVLSQVVEPMNHSFTQTSVISILSLTTSTTEIFPSPTITPQNDLIPVSSTLLVTPNELSTPISTTETNITALPSSCQAQILQFDSNNRALSTTIQWITRSASLSPSTSFTTTTQIPPEPPTSATNTTSQITFESAVSPMNSDTTTLVSIYPIYPNSTTRISAESTIPTKITSTTNQISYESTILTIDSSTQIPSIPTTSTINPGIPALTPTYTVDSSATTLVSAYTIKSRTTSLISSESAIFTTDSSTTIQVHTTQNSRPSRSFPTSTIEITSTALDISTSAVPTAAVLATPSSSIDQTFSNDITSLISTSRISKSKFTSESSTIITTPTTRTSPATSSPAPALTSSIAASVQPPSVSSSPITEPFLPGDMAASTTVTYLNSTYTLIQVYTRSHN
ncbi:hypothetical protein SS1G_02600 [Sclerotinia sclerotiorum 1980 UF-70]|uniref:Ig-like domain-containing protein n=1 Tax=Sclerotinia sclerotiorum (strain ATCC 18683 / 1980 / Ss-1) TaxID=665079 RepID=A7EBB4_SCLS1|nr:hypothetical protein SS1G_02600 [Sclerotinia sclerotiorum 1980 UF-70]EDN99742.1 hypothetical protein SS1G_02600 [Sclerotinia sclerotiorum 1980 UF-70]